MQTIPLRPENLQKLRRHESDIHIVLRNKSGKAGRITHHIIGNDTDRYSCHKCSEDHLDPHDKTERCSCAKAFACMFLCFQSCNAACARIQYALVTEQHTFRPSCGTGGVDQKRRIKGIYICHITDRLFFLQSLKKSCVYPDLCTTVHGNVSQSFCGISRIQRGKHRPAHPCCQHHTHIFRGPRKFNRQEISLSDLKPFQLSGRTEGKFNQFPVGHPAIRRLNGTLVRPDCRRFDDQIP